MKRRYTILITIMSAVAFWNICGITAEASSKDTAYEKIYTELANGKDEASAEYPTDSEISPEEFSRFVANIDDDPDNLFDGSMIFTRGYTAYQTKNGKLIVKLNNGYDIEKADALTDEMVRVISKRLNDGSSERDKMSAICDYISETYSYDKEASEDTNSGIFGTSEDFVTAYYGNKKILCTDYAALTYLLANKMGIKCDLINGKGHIYNIVKFSDNENRIAYDLASESRYAQITYIDYLFNDMYHTDDGSKASILATAANNGKTYAYAGPKEYIASYMYFTFTAHHLPEISALVIIVIGTLKTIIDSIRRKSGIARKYSKRNRLARA